MANNKSTLFIPDIGGFTNFVQQNDSEHSQHIISELLESLIDSNQTGLSLSEVEGDAVMFYRKDALSLNDLLSQVVHSFKKFHINLQKYQHDRMCECGACRGATKLTLKFVAHQGLFSFIKIKEQQKPYGEDVILVHRLLKNDVPHEEYLLIPQNAISEAEIEAAKKEFDWLEVHPIDLEYSDMGNIPCYYVPIERLHDIIPAYRGVEMPKKVEKPIVVKGKYKIDEETFKQYLTDFNLRTVWNKDVKKIDYDPKELNRKGSKHLCVFEKGDSLELETVTNDFGPGRFVYGERLINPKIFKEFAVYYILETLDDGVELTIEAHYCLPTWAKYTIEPFLRGKLKKNLEKGINNFKTVEELEKVA